MKKIVKSLLIVALVALAFGTAGAVYAQSSTPAVGSTAVGGNFARGGRGGRDGFGQAGGNLAQVSPINLDGVLHDELIASFAAALELPESEIESRLADGETLSEIALSTGLTQDDFFTLMDKVHGEVINQAVKDGLLTEEQADWMLSRSNRRLGGQVIDGGRGMGRGMYGSGTYGNGMYGSGTCLNE